MADLALSGLHAMPFPLTLDKYTLGGSSECDISVPELGGEGPILTIELEGGVVRLTLLVERNDVTFAGMPVSAHFPIDLVIGDSFEVAGRVLAVTYGLYSAWKLREPGVKWAVARFIVGFIIISTIFPASVFLSGFAQVPSSMQKTVNFRTLSWDLAYSFPAPAVFLIAKYAPSIIRDTKDGLESARSQDLKELAGTPEFAEVFAGQIFAAAQTAFTDRDLILLSCYGIASAFLNCGGFLEVSASSRIKMDDQPFLFRLSISRGGLLSHAFLIFLYMFTLYGPVNFFLLARGAYSATTLIMAAVRYGIRFVLAIVIVITVISIIAGASFSYMLKTIGLLDFLVKWQIATPFNRPLSLLLLLLIHVGYNVVAIGIIVLLNYRKLKGYMQMEGDLARTTGAGISKGSKEAVGASGRLLKNLKERIDAGAKKRDEENRAWKEISRNTGKDIPLSWQDDETEVADRVRKSLGEAHGEDSDDD
jgi:hypothetical protein